MKTNVDHGRGDQPIKSSIRTEIVSSLTTEPKEISGVVVATCHSGMIVLKERTHWSLHCELPIWNHIAKYCKFSIQCIFFLIAWIKVIVYFSVHALEWIMCGRSDDINWYEYLTTLPAEVSALAIQAESAGFHWENPFSHFTQRTSYCIYLIRIPLPNRAYLEYELFTISSPPPRNRAVIK